jgi:hypothetical protein
MYVRVERGYGERAGEARASLVTRRQYKNPPIEEALCELERTAFEAIVTDKSRELFDA